MNIFKRFFYYLRLRKAVELADNLYKSTGRRHYVMPSPGHRCELLVMDRGNFRKLRQKHYINGEARVFNLVQESFYFTPHRGGSGALSEKDRRHKFGQYYSWVSANLKNNKKRRRK